MLLVDMLKLINQDDYGPEEGFEPGSPENSWNFSSIKIFWSTEFFFGLEVKLFFRERATRLVQVLQLDWGGFCATEWNNLRRKLKLDSGGEWKIGSPSAVCECVCVCVCVREEVKAGRWERERERE